MLRVYVSVSYFFIINHMKVVSACNVVALGAIKEEGDLDSWSGSTAIELPVRRHSG